jgi:polyisoprenoid-binding protein YceI
MSTSCARNGSLSSVETAARQRFGAARPTYKAGGGPAELRCQYEGAHPVREDDRGQAPPTYGGNMAAPTSTAPRLEDLVGDYALDPAHTRIGFTARHAMVTRVRGQFREYQGHGHLDMDPAKTWAEVRIQAGSIDTGNDQRDEHLRQNDFLDAQHYPEIVFRSTHVERVSDEVYRVTGDLTIKATTRAITIDLHYTGAVTDPFGNLRLGLEGTTTINRKDWGVSWNVALEAGGMLVSECINIEIDVSAIKVGPDQ